MRLSNWLKRKTPKARPNKIVLPIVHGITLELWQSRSESVKWARELWLSKEGSELLSVVRNEMPVAEKGDDPSYALGRMRGYMEALGVMSMLAIHKSQVPAAIPETYDDPDKQQAEEGEEPLT